MNNDLSENKEARGREGVDARHRQLRPRMQKQKEIVMIRVDWVLASLREIKWGLAHRPGHRHAVRPRWKRVIEGVLYALMKLLLP